jgi:hypothetical protein
VFGYALLVLLYVLENTAGWVRFKQMDSYGFGAVVVSGSGR